MITENLSTLEINKLTKAQYERELAAGNINENALYLTPEEEMLIDATLSISNMSADAKATGDAISAVSTLVNTLVGDISVSEQINSAIDGKADKATTLEGYGITDAASKAYVDTIMQGLSAEGTANANVVQAALNAHKNDKNNPHNVALNQLGVDATAIELNYVSGVTSNIQTQLNGKVNKVNAFARDDVDRYMDAIVYNKADGTRLQYIGMHNKSGIFINPNDDGSSNHWNQNHGLNIGPSALKYNGDTVVTSTSLQTQLDAKANVSHNHSASNITSGTLSVARGGTGATTEKVAQVNLLKDMSESTNPIDDDGQLVFKYTTPDSSRGVLLYKKASTLWTYIAGKIRETFGFSNSNVLTVAKGGTGATTATEALKNLGIKYGATLPTSGTEGQIFFLLDE